MNQGLLSWTHHLSTSSTSLILPFPFSQNRNPSRITAATFNSVEESPMMTGRERRQMRNERRESKPSYNWKEEVEMRLIKKPKKRYTSWTDELNLDNLALLGPQWWVVRVSRVSGHDTAERMARSLARNFPDIDFKVYIPSVQIKRKLKNGTLSVKPKPLFPGCMFLRCVLNKELHDFIRECDGVGGFVGSKVGNTKRQINKPRPVDADDMEAIYEQAKVEQEKADKKFDEEQQAEGAKISSEKAGVDPPSVSKDATLADTITKIRGRGRKSTKRATVGNGISLVPGSTVQVSSGAFAGYSGILKKIDEKTGLVTVGFTLFGKETLADIDANEVIPETN